MPSKIAKPQFSRGEMLHSVAFQGAELVNTPLTQGCDRWRDLALIVPESRRSQHASAARLFVSLEPMTLAAETCRARFFFGAITAVESAAWMLQDTQRLATNCLPDRSHDLAQTFARGAALGPPTNAQMTATTPRL